MGELAALLTAVFWSISSIALSNASNLAGAMNVNRIRLVFAVIFLSITHLITRGSLIPVDGHIAQWTWLGLSGIAGLVFGDACLLTAYTLIGTRLGTLMIAGVPVISTLLAWIFLGETLRFAELAGVLVTVGGIMWVVLERGNGNSIRDRRKFALGLLYGLGAALGQAAGLVMSKQGMAGGYPALSAVMMRMLVAMVVMWLITLVGGQVRQTVRTAIENREAMRHILVGAVFGPFLGVWMSLIAVQSAYVGIASTLMALTPVLVLPVMKWRYKENVSLRALAGTLTALAGVALIFLADGWF